MNIHFKPILTLSLGMCLIFSNSILAQTEFFRSKVDFSESLWINIIIPLVSSKIWFIWNASKKIDNRPEKILKQFLL